jgi:hypothetical protein
MAIKQFNVTELDFDNIKSAIKNYYKRTDSPFKDFDFEGSGLNLILDVLSYNTHYNAILAHLAANESFIASAQLRKNVVARAKTLGYIPHSVTASTVGITLSGVDPSIVSIPEGTIFTSSDTLNGITYTFININEISDVNSEFQIYQGSFKTQQFIFDNKAENLKFEMPEKNIDISKLRVSILDHGGTNKIETYSRFSELAGLDESSLVYFINENPNGRYEVSFGDNILGKKPGAGAVVTLKYLVTDGKSANGLSTFTTSDPLFDGLTKPTITLSSSTTGGGAKESIESIRANAPLNFLSQNRAVTVDDYKAIVRNNINVNAISVWGGEDNIPPEYGKVFLSVKPQNGDTLSQDEQDFLLPILDKKGILTVKPKFVDPDYVYLYFDIFTKFNSSLTSLSTAGISSEIRNALVSFNTAYLSDFDGVFRYSEFLKYLSNANPAILSVFARVKAYKIFTASITSTSNYMLNYNFALEEPQDPTVSLISSDGFNISGVTHYFADEPSTIPHTRNIYMYRLNPNGVAIMTRRNVGIVNCQSGVITIDDFDIDADTDISIFAKPSSNDIAPTRNQIIEIDVSTHTQLYSSIDTIATGGSTGSIGYETTPRETY